MKTYTEFTQQINEARSEFAMKSLKNGMRTNDVFLNFDPWGEKGKFDITIGMYSGGDTATGFKGLSTPKKLAELRKIQWDNSDEGKKAAQEVYKIEDALKSDIYDAVVKILSKADDDIIKEVNKVVKKYS